MSETPTEFEKSIADISSTGDYGDKKISWINLDDEWKVVKIRTDFSVVKKFYTYDGSKSHSAKEGDPKAYAKYFLKCDNDAVLSITEYQMRVLADFIKNNVLDEVSPDTIAIELKIGINKENGRPILKCQMPAKK